MKFFKILFLVLSVTSFCVASSEEPGGGAGWFSDMRRGIADMISPEDSSGRLVTRTPVYDDPESLYRRGLALGGEGMSLIYQAAQMGHPGAIYTWSQMSPMITGGAAAGAGRRDLLGSYATETVSGKYEYPFGGFTYFHEGNYHRALPLLFKAADGGLPEAVFLIGVAYYRGLGVKQNKVEASRKFKEAGEMGLLEAKFWYGACLWKGHGVPEPSPVLGFEAICEAALGGHKEAEIVKERESSFTGRIRNYAKFFTKEKMLKVAVEIAFSRML